MALAKLPETRAVTKSGTWFINTSEAERTKLAPYEARQSATLLNDLGHAGKDSPMFSGRLINRD